MIPDHKVEELLEANFGPKSYMIPWLWADHKTLRILHRGQWYTAELRGKNKMENERELDGFFMILKMRAEMRK